MQSIDLGTPAARTRVSNDVTPIRTTLTLDDLAAMTFDDLANRYAAAARPETLTPLDGAPIGRMLAVRGLSFDAVASPLRKFAGSASFVWGGKSFTSSNATTGRGINRVRLGGFLGRQNLFPFEMKIGASEVDGDAAIILDYDLPENPGYIRKIHDEVRALEPGLYLGPAMWKGASGKTTVLYFALDARV